MKLNKKVVFVDLKEKLANEGSLASFVCNSDKIISLTPYSTYLLEKLKVNFIQFSELQKSNVFNKEVFNDYSSVEKAFKQYELNQYLFLLRDIAKYIAFDHYCAVLHKELFRNESVYITSGIKISEFGRDAFLDNFLDFSKIIKLKTDTNFYRRNKLNVRFASLRKKKLIKRIYNKFVLKDLYNYSNELNAEDYKKVQISNSKKVILDFNKESLLHVIKNIKLSSSFSNLLLKELENFPLLKDNHSTYLPFMFLHGEEMYSRFVNYKSRDIPVIIMQHGSYIHEDYFLKFNEILPANVNLVFNSFTKKLFDKNGSVRPEIVGAGNYSEIITPRKKQFDFIYITYCTQYSYSGMHVSSKDYTLSPTSENIYNRHKDVIESFGKNFPDKKLCIKVQPGIFLSTQLYVPLLELSKDYPNVTIKFNENLFSLIEKSQYILSDYFSSEFSNRNLLENRDVILFGDIIKVSDSYVLQDLSDMFVVVNSIEEMNEAIINIEEHVVQKQKSKTERLISKYTSPKNINTKAEVKKVIDEYLIKK